VELQEYFTFLIKKHHYNRFKERKRKPSTRCHHLIEKTSQHTIWNRWAVFIKTVLTLNPNLQQGQPLIPFFISIIPLFIISGAGQCFRDFLSCRHLVCYWPSTTSILLNTSHSRPLRTATTISDVSAKQMAFHHCHLRTGSGTTVGKAYSLIGC
jgi:hypothetical protein